MNFRTTYILFGLLAVALIVFGVALWYGPEKANTAFVLPSAHDKPEVKADAIDYVEIEHTRPKQEKIAFTRDPETKAWKMTQPYELRTERFVVERLVGQVLDARKDEKAEVSSNLAEWGLDNPAAVVTLRKGDEKTWNVNLGKESTGGESRVVYVTSSDRSKEVMAVRYSDLATAYKSVNEFRAKDLLADNAFDIQGINLQDGTHTPVILEQAGPSRWRFQQPPFGLAEYEGDSTALGAAPGKPTGVRGLTEAAAGLKVEYKSETDNDFVAVNEPDLARYGLESGPKAGRLRIEVK